MEKVFYLIPGWEDTTDQEMYQKLADAVRAKGYTVTFIDVDWKRPLSEQLFEVPETAIIFGFSLGAILAWLVAQKYPCEKLLLASMTQHTILTVLEAKNALAELTGKEFADDIIAHLKPITKAKKQITLYGDSEGEPADIIVPSTGHVLSENYIKAIEQLL